MIQTLKQFTGGTRLFDAVSALMAKLHIEFDRETAEPIDVAGLYDRPMPNYLTQALECIDKTYFIGVINDRSLAGDKSDDSLDSITGTIRHGGKYDGMFVFACDAKPEANLTRTVASALTRAFNRIAVANPVILIIRQGNMLSMATCERMTYTQEWRQGSGEKLGRVSILRCINCDSPHRGHVDILETLGDKSYPTFEELYKHWMKVFNSELLTQKFYDDLFEWYQWAVNPETKVSFPGDADIQNDDREDIDTRVIRLITRLMFVWFIKQKELIPDRIFDVQYVKSILVDSFDPLSTTGTEYYQAILQNLFFGTLNRAILEDGEHREFAKASRSDVKNLYRYEELFTISEQEVIDLFATVPFLNCGLFECLDKTKMLDGVSRRYYNDGFSRNATKFSDGTFRYRAVVPNILFFHPEKGILSIFEKYVFTIEENTPQDVQVALDPELLGKVFENLLGAYNPETKETARNQSGSFYTPREIVQYMVNESLVAHLKRTVGSELESKFRELLDFTTETVDLTDKQKKDILHSLFTCKILDPACGSGAFPMGMLQQMVHILQQVDPDNSQWREVLLNLAVDESRRAFGINDEKERQQKLLEIEETFNNGLNSPDYTRKLYIIESCIYGVDIQPIAMLITRLRFFITLICEQRDIRRDKPEENFGIKTLPNLESKFVAANSLIDADIHRYNEDWTQNEELSILKDELMAIRRRHFYTRRRSEKMKLLRDDEKKREQIHTLINKLVGEPNHGRIVELNRIIDEQKARLPEFQDPKWVEESIQQNLFDPPTIIKVDVNKRQRDQINAQIEGCQRDIEHELNKCTPTGFEAAVLQVTDWNPYDQNSVSPFFDIEWMFGVTDGFDIIIGNPPYIQLQNNGGELSKLYQPCGYESYSSMGDIYCLFYERGWRLLKNDRLLCYITSNKWMRAGYGEKLRSFLASKTNPQLLVDFGGVKVFESATVDTNILLLSKSVNSHNTRCAVTNKQNKDTLKQLSVFVQQQGTSCDFSGGDSWVILSPIEQSIKRKIEAVGTPLKDWDINIYRGVLTGYNDAFIIPTEKRNEILANCQTEDERIRTEELIRPILRGRDIKRYSYEWAGQWLIASFPARHYDIERFPAVKKHLESFAYDNLIENGYAWVANNYLSEYCRKKLEQSGKDVIIDGKHILDAKGTKEKSRKKTTNKWFETQDSISYWEEFIKPKIIWKRIGSILRFSYDKNSCLGLDSTCFAVGEHIEYLCCVLNSLMGHYLLKDSPKTGTGDLLVSVQAIEPTYIPYQAQYNEVLVSLLDKQATEHSDDIEKEINDIVFAMYDLSLEEREYVSLYVIQSQQSQ